MKEERRAIRNYEKFYDITSSGRIYSYARKRYLTRKNDEYGFHIVKLSKEGVSSNFNVYQLWRSTFSELSDEEFKGARKVKYK